MKKKNGSVVIKAFLILGGMLVGLGLFEIALRQLEPTSDANVLISNSIQSGEYLTLIPGSSGLITGRMVNINEHGYRGKLYPHKKPENKTRILFFGDSHTFSMGADNNSAYPARVEQYLNTNIDDYEVLNFGVLGHDLRQILIHIDNNAFRYEPDVIIITFHGGDILESSGREAASDAPNKAGPSLLYRLKRDAMKYSYTARLAFPYGIAFVRSITDWSPGITTAELHEIEQNGSKWRSLQNKILSLKKITDSRDIKLAFVLFPRMSNFENHPVHKALETWLKANKIPAIDLLPYFIVQNPSALTASLLDKHPNEQAYDIVGDAVANFLRGQLLPK